MTVGIDIGGTTTKIVGLGDSGDFVTATVKASDPVASAAGAIGKFLSVSGKRIRDIGRLAVTGVGSSFLGDDILGIDIVRVDEFHAIGLGGLRLSGASRALVVSVGTGTALVHAMGSEARHVGGSGIGGGTILGLGKALAGITDFDSLAEVAGRGRVEHVDLTISDIAANAVGTLPSNATASNFGRMADRPSTEDMAAGIVNLVFQTVGVLAMLAARAESDETIVVIGNTMRIPMARTVLDSLYPIYGVRFQVPDQAEYATALGAALYLRR